MSRIKGKNTKPEIIVRKFLFKEGMRFRIHVKNLPGRPDVVLPKYKTVIFVHGCFWHGHDNCKDYVVPKTRTDWWLKKIERNKQLDREYLLKLTSDGWQVYIVFECELKREKISHTLSQILTYLSNTLQTKVLKNSSQQSCESSA